jgi:hypothetical protein
MTEEPNPAVGEEAAAIRSKNIAVHCPQTCLTRAVNQREADLSARR